MPSTADIRLAEIDAQLAALAEERKALLPQTTVACPYCKHEHAIADLVVLAWQSYAEPYSCAGGDYWYTSSIGFKCRRCERSPSWSEEGRPPKPNPLRNVQHFAAGRLEIERQGLVSRARLVGPWKPDARERVIQDLTINGIVYSDKSTPKLKP